MEKLKLTHDTTSGIMAKRKLAKLRRELQKLRAGKYNVKTSEIVRFAKRVGRVRDTSRGKEPTYISPRPGVLPLSIPGHPTINPHTANSILDVLESDIDREADLLESKERKENEERKRIPPAAVHEGCDSGGT